MTAVHQSCFAEILGCDSFAFSKTTGKKEWNYSEREVSFYAIISAENNIPGRWMEC